MAIYDPFGDGVYNGSTNPSSSCSSCINRPSLATSSVGSSASSITTISSYEEGWDDHEGPIWTNPLDADSVAKQAGFARKKSRVLKRMPSRCTPQPAQEEKKQRGQHALPITVGDPAIPCPPDIEEIDLYMPYVEHKWFNSPQTTKSVEEPRDIALVVHDDTEVATTSKAQPGCSSRAATRKARGCGYSCNVHDVRKAGLTKPEGAPQMVEVSRRAWSGYFEVICG